MIFMRFRGPQALNDTYKKHGSGVPVMDRRWSIPSTPWGAECKPGEAPGLLINVVLGLKPFEQGLQERLRRIRRSADRLCHFLGSRREIPSVRRNSGERQVADPMIRILLRNVRVQFKSSLGVARSLQAASVGVQLDRAGFIERLGKQFGGFFFSSQYIEDPGFSLQILKALFIL